MNSFRSAIMSGNGLHPKDPLVRQKKKKGATEDDLSSVEVPRSEKRNTNQRDDDRQYVLEHLDESERTRHAG